MKTFAYICLILFGFNGHKILEEVYDYKFEQGFNSKVCMDQYIKDIQPASGVAAPLTKRFECTYSQMGVYGKLKYVLMRPHFSDDTGNRWYY